MHTVPLCDILGSLDFPTVCFFCFSFTAGVAALCNILPSNIFLVIQSTYDWIDVAWVFLDNYYTWGEGGVMWSFDPGHIII